MDIHPAISPDGSRVAFASNRGGQWDIFVLDLPTGEVTRLTDTPAYDGHPSWSPDGLWIAHDTYLEDNLDIVVRPVDGSQPPIRLTYDPRPDFSPAWSPQGRRIAFVSSRSGEQEIWLADLDKVEERFVNLSRNRQVEEDHPLWNASGDSLAWSGTEENGERAVYVWNGTGRRPACPWACGRHRRCRPRPRVLLGSLWWRRYACRGRDP
jgi:TolB protein